MERTRRIATDGAPNLRDLGGYPAADGKTVKWGMVYRSDDLSALSEEDVEVLAGLNVRTVIDFRSRQEIVFSPDRLPKTVTRVVNIPIDAGRLVSNFFGGTMNRKKAMGIMTSVYRQLADDYAASFRDFMSVIADTANAPLLFHCTAGKDRTGIGAALFLSALGVPRDRVVEDYLLSAEYLEKKYAARSDRDDATAPIYTVYPEFINAALGVIDESHGGVEKYLRDELAVDAARFRAAYTE